MVLLGTQLRRVVDDVICFSIVMITISKFVHIIASGKLETPNGTFLNIKHEQIRKKNLPVVPESNFWNLKK